MGWVFNTTVAWLAYGIAGLVKHTCHGCLFRFFLAVVEYKIQQIVAIYSTMIQNDSDIGYKLRKCIDPYRYKWIQSANNQTETGPAIFPPAAGLFWRDGWNSLSASWTRIAAVRCGSESHLPGSNRMSRAASLGYTTWWSYWGLVGH